MSIWNEHKPAGGSGDYLKLKSGDKKKVRFYTDPAIVTYDGNKIRYRVVLYNKTDNLAQIFEFGPQIFGQVGDLYEDWGEPTEMDLTISRKGSTRFDTEYTVNPVKVSEPLTPAQEAVAKAVSFPGNRSKMLAQYELDHILPETIETSKSETSYATSDAELNSLDEVAPDEDVINLDDIPFGGPEDKA